MEMEEQIKDMLGEEKKKIKELEGSLNKGRQELKEMRRLYRQKERGYNLLVGKVAKKEKKPAEQKKEQKNVQ